MANDKPVLFEDAVELADALAETLPATVDEVRDKAAEAVDVVIERLDQNPLIEALRLANDALPRMVKDLVDAYFDPNQALSVAERVKIFGELKDLSLTDDRSRKVLGLMKEQMKEGASMVFQQLNLNTREMRNLPAGSIDEHLKRVAQGGGDDEQVYEVSEPDEQNG